MSGEAIVKRAGTGDAAAQVSEEGGRLPRGREVPEAGGEHAAGALVAAALWVVALGWLAGTWSLTLLQPLRRRAAPESPVRAAFWGDEEKLAALLFWSAAGVFLFLRAVGPAIVGQEKFMDLGFLNSLARYGAMPPAVAAASASSTR